MTTEPASITSRAHEAALYMRAAIAEDPDPLWHAKERALAHLRLAGLLAIPLAAVTVTDDGLRTVHPHDALILTAIDPVDPATTYRFALADPRYEDEPFYLLGRCPGCTGEVTLQTVRSLADLENAHRPLDFPADGSLPEVLRTDFGHPDFLADPGHRTGCRYRT